MLCQVVVPLNTTASVGVHQQHLLRHPWAACVLKDTSVPSDQLSQRRVLQVTTATSWARAFPQVNARLVTTAYQWQRSKCLWSYPRMEVQCVDPVSTVYRVLQFLYRAQVALSVQHI